MDAFLVALASVINDSGFVAFTTGNAIMMLVGCVLLYLAIVKGFEPLLLTPIAFGCLLANVPRTGFETDPGVMQLILGGIKYEVFPPLIFMGVGAMTDFGPRLPTPKPCSWAQLPRPAYSLPCWVQCCWASTCVKLLLSASSVVLTARLPFTWQPRWLPICWAQSL